MILGMIYWQLNMAAVSLYVSQKYFQIAAIVAIFIFTNVLLLCLSLPFSEVALILSFPTNKRWQQLPAKITESSNVYLVKKTWLSSGPASTASLPVWAYALNNDLQKRSRLSSLKRILSSGGYVTTFAKAGLVISIPPRWFPNVSDILDYFGVAVRFPRILNQDCHPGVPVWPAQQTKSGLLNCILKGSLRGDS